MTLDASRGPHDVSVEDCIPPLLVGYAPLALVGLTPKQEEVLRKTDLFFS